MHPAVSTAAPASAAALMLIGLGWATASTVLEWAGVALLLGAAAVALVRVWPRMV